MGSSVSGLYSGTRGSSEPKNGATYNTARSSSVGRVDVVINDMGHSVPNTFKPYSVYRRSGRVGLISERYYNGKGEPYLDIDYTNHGNAMHHPVVPHQHTIKYQNGKMSRLSKGRKIQ